MMAERGVAVSHTTILRWVLRYVPEYEKRWARYARPVSASWRVDETAISIRGKNQYLYRAVDGRGESVDHLLCADRSRDAAQAFFRKAVITRSGQWPRTVNLDGNAASHLALRLLGQEEARWAVDTGATTSASTGNRRHSHWGSIPTSRSRQRGCVIVRLDICSLPVPIRR
jgi:transposase-like protein